MANLEKVMSGEVDALSQFFKSELGYEGEIDPSTDLLEEGILDSFNVVEVAMFIQEHYGIELKGEDVTRENFASLNDMIALIRLRAA